MKKRIISLDIFRGLTVALMIIVNNPGSWTNVFPPLRHSAWDGCTLTDLVFPFYPLCPDPELTAWQNWLQWLYAVLFMLSNLCVALALHKKKIFIKI